LDGKYNCFLITGSLIHFVKSQLSSRHATGEVDVWFVLLERPNVKGSADKSRPQQTMADAYKVLHDVTNRHTRLSVKLDLAPNKKLVSD